MSEIDMDDEVIHFWRGDAELSLCGVDVMHVPYTYGSPEWPEVTCGACKLEMPMRAVAGRTEYRTPADVAARDADPTIGGPSLADMLTEHEQRRLKAVRAWEQHARETMAYWLKEWETAVSLLRTLERDAGVPASTPGDSEGAQTLSRLPKLPTPEQVRNLSAAEAVELAASMNANGYALRHAPFNAAVDMRTDMREDEDMADNLSDRAKEALINGQKSASGIIAGPRSELEAAGLVGRSGRLTRKGSITRQKLVKAAEDKAFG